MEGRNGYFSVVHKEDGVYLRIYPSTGEGSKMNIDEIKSYLFRHDIYEFSQKPVKNALSNNMETDVKISSEVSLEIDEEMYIKPSNDNMIAYAVFYPPSEGGSLLTKDKIKAQMRSTGIVVEPNIENIDSFLADKIYATDYEIAKAIPPVEGTNASIKYNFSLDKNLKPQLNSDGTVDFHHLDNINNVEEGDLLARLTPAVEGVNGMDIYGKNVKCKEVKKMKLKYAKNVFISDDELELHAATNGHVYMVADAVNVSSVYEIESNVDMTTGDIQCKGDVHVKGSVLTGFSIKADGGVTVDGVVEGAIIQAGGNVIVKQGIQGMKHGAINAEGDIVSKFIENACVTAGGNIHTETIMHSNVNAMGKIIVTSKKGFIVGGIIRSAREIRCKTAGSVMETQTILQVGVDAESEEELKKTERKIIKLQKDQEDCLKVMRLYKKKMNEGEYFSKEKVFLIKELAAKNKQLTENINELIVQYDGLKKYLEAQAFPNGRVIVEGVSNMGVKVVISGVICYIRRETTCSKFTRERADIIIEPLTQLSADE